MRSTNTIAITGASGFIGKFLESQLLEMDGYEIRVLSRDIERDLSKEKFGHDVKMFEGDLCDQDSLKGFLVTGCVVVNLVYLWNAGEAQNLSCTHNLLAACKAAGVARLIHCSTAAVAGRTANDLIDEETQCLPVTEYGTTKLKIEQDIIEYAKGNFEAIILRPTSVYGIEGEPLKKLAADITGGSRWKNYLKSCLFGRRRMNLVHVANVVAAILFIIRYDASLDGEIYIVSDDEDQKNNFFEVEQFLMDAFGVRKYPLPRLPLPLGLLKLLLIFLGRNNVNPSCNFDSGKLQKLGFQRPVSLKDGLAEYATWCRPLLLADKASKAP